MQLTSADIRLLFSEGLFSLLVLSLQLRLCPLFCLSCPGIRTGLFWDPKACSRLHVGSRPRSAPGSAPAAAEVQRKLRLVRVSITLGRSGQALRASLLLKVTFPFLAQLTRVVFRSCFAGSCFSPDSCFLADSNRKCDPDAEERNVS